MYPIEVYSSLIALLFIDLLLCVITGLNYRKLRYRFLFPLMIALACEAIRHAVNTVVVAAPDVEYLYLISAALFTSRTLLVLATVVSVTNSAIRTRWYTLPTLLYVLILTAAYVIQFSVALVWQVSSLPLISIYIGACWFLSRKERLDDQGKRWISSLLLAMALSQALIAGFVTVLVSLYGFFYLVETILMAALAMALNLIAVGRVHQSFQEAKAETFRSEKKFRNLVEHINELVWEVDQDGAYTYITPNVQNILGYRPEEVIGKTRFDFMPKEEAQRVSPILGSIVLDRRPLDALIHRSLRKDGSPILIECSGMPIIGSGEPFQGYRGVDRDVTDRRLVEEALQSLAAVTTEATGREFSRSLVRYLAGAFQVRFAFVSEIEAGAEDSLRTLAIWQGEGIGDNFLYAMKGTPCEHVLAKNGATYPSEVQKLFSEDSWLRENKVESYMAVPMLSQEGELMGIVGLMNDGPMADNSQRESLLRLFSSRAGAELGRYRAEQALKSSGKRLQILLEIDRALSAAQSPGKIAQAALYRLRQIVPYRRASVVAFDHTTGQSVPLGVAGQEESTLAPRDGVPLEAVPFWEKLRQGEVTVVEDMQAFPQPPEFIKSLIEAGVRSIVSVPLIVEDEVIGALNLGAVKARAFTPEHIEIVREVSTSLAVAIRQSQLFERVEVARERLQSLSRRLVEVQEGERRHLARELHDEIAQVLTGTKLALERCARLPSDQAGTELEKARSLVNELLGKVRSLSLDLRPAMLDDLGLLPTLLWHFERFGDQNDMEVVFEHEGLRDRRFSSDVETTLYRIVQEALTNAARHAGVSQVEVKVSASRANLTAELKDEGAGFNLTTGMKSASGGLMGMTERAALVGGRLDIKSDPGKGTVLRVELPL